jgi:hypothetical protein
VSNGDSPSSRIVKNVMASADGPRPRQLRIVTGSCPALPTDPARRPQRQDENLKAAEGISQHPIDHTSPHKHTFSPTHFRQPVKYYEGTGTSGSALGSQLRRGVLADRRRLPKNSFGLSFRGAAGDEESRLGLETLRARFLSVS